MLKCASRKGFALVDALRTTSLRSSAIPIVTSTFLQKRHTSSDDNLNLDAARKWFAQHGDNPINNEIGEVSYARSSGPGGQNVNKVNSKAQLRVSLDVLLPLIPSALHEGIRKSRYHAENSSSLLIQSDESRRQSANKETCYRRLNELIVDVYRQCVPGETSVAQKEKVKRLQHTENESRLKMKKIQSSKKASRGRGSFQ